MVYLLLEEVKIEKGNILLIIYLLIIVCSTEGIFELLD